MTTYDPRKDPHPVEASIRALGELTLVGSRAILGAEPIATPESDWDFYLVPKVPPEQPEWANAPWLRENARMDTVRNALNKLGFKLLPGEGGPYGRDQQIYGIWRLEAHTAYGRDWPGVDVIVVTPEVWKRRRGVLARIAQLGRPGGLLCRGLKAEVAWGSFWWAISDLRSA